MKPLGIAFLVLAACACPLHGQSHDAEDLCSKYADTPLPAEAQQASTPKKWPDCESYKLYSGIGAAADYEAARRCAWEERLATEANIQPEDMTDSVVGASAMLTVLYSNGEGVEQNAYTTFDMNFCARFASEMAAQKRQNTLDAVSAPWTNFAVLEKAAEDYVEAHGRGEVYQGGTIRGLRTNGVEERQREKFLAAVQEFESGHLPKGTAVEFRKADRDLNATYNKALVLAAHQNFEEDNGLLRPEGIRESERTWLKYRDAWVAFAKLHYPTTDSDAWLTLLTTNRVWSLRMTLCEVGWGDPACHAK